MKTQAVPVTVFILALMFALTTPSSILFAVVGTFTGIAAYWLYTRYFSLRTLGRCRRFLWTAAALILRPAALPFVLLTGSLLLGASCVLFMVLKPPPPDNPGSTQGPTPPPEILIGLTYSCRLRCDESNRQWHLTEFLVERETRTYGFQGLALGEPGVLNENVDSAKRLLIAHLIANGWSHSTDQEQQRRFLREQEVPLSNRWYPFHTVNNIPLLPHYSSLFRSEENWSFEGETGHSPELVASLIGTSPAVTRTALLMSRLRYSPRIEAHAVRNKDSVATIIAPKDAIKATYPAYTSQAERLHNGDVELVVPLESVSTDESEVKIDVLSPLVRNEALKWIYGQLVSPAFNWCLLVVCGIFGERIRKSFLAPAIIRLRLRFGIYWPVLEWTLAYQRTNAPCGSKVRFVSKRGPFTLHWAFNDWSRPQDTGSYRRSSPMGSIDCVDIRIPRGVARLMFTFRWNQSDWQHRMGEHFEIVIGKEAEFGGEDGGKVHE